MFTLLYNIAIRCYYFLLFVVSFFNPKAKKWIAGRQKIAEDIEPIFLSKKKTIWFHCASVGEFEQAFPLLLLLRNEFPKYVFHITFFSPSGYEYAKKKYPAESISYLPYDTSSSMDYFIRKINPALVFVVKYEYWFNMLHLLHQKSIPTFLVSGIVRPDHLFFKWYGKSFRIVLSFFKHLFLQDEKSQQLLKSIGIENSSVTGDTRFDRVLALSQEPFSDEKIRTFINNAPVFVGGSVWDSDLPTLKKIINALPVNWKIILAPHEINHFSTDWLEDDFSYYVDEKLHSGKVLIINTIGILSKLYRFSSLSYVGGGYGRGLHNILEPAIYEHPILIGPNFEKFNEAVQLVQVGCVFPTQNDENIDDLVIKLSTNTNTRKEISEKISSYISINTNVSEKIAVYIRKNCKL